MLMHNMIDLLIDDGIQSFVDAKIMQKAVDLSCLRAKNIRNTSLCIRFADNNAVQALNKTWRKQDKVTDVLSFPMLEADEIEDGAHLGDMILAIPFVHQEATNLTCSAQDHCVHLIIHSTLHLLGYDHIQDDEASIMQNLENQIMAALNLHCPYPTLNREQRA